MAPRARVDALGFGMAKLSPCSSCRRHARELFAGDACPFCAHTQGWTKALVAGAALVGVLGQTGCEKDGSSTPEASTDGQSSPIVEAEPDDSAGQDSSDGDSDKGREPPIERDPGDDERNRMVPLYAAPPPG